MVKEGEQPVSLFRGFLEKMTHRQLLEEQIAALGMQIDNGNEQISQLKRQLAAERSDAADMEKQLAGCAQEIAQMKRQLAALAGNAAKESVQLEQERTEQSRFVKNELQNILSELETVKNRLSILEMDRTELFSRIDLAQEKIENSLIALDKIHILEQDRTRLFQRVDNIWLILRACGLSNMNSRIDSRIIRLEILWYYQKKSRREKLDAEELKLLDMLEYDYEYERDKGRTFPEDSYYNPDKKKELPYKINCEDNMWYADINGKKLFLGENKRDSEEYLRETLFWLESDTPHRYLDPDKDKVDIPKGCILLDIGAAEGFFGIRYLERCKKIYFFEYDEKWLRYLRKTCAPYSDKVEIVEGYVGDREQDIRLDDFFKDREKPTVIKMDVEGAEGAILRGMKNLIENDDPLTILLCTYHREEDWQRYFEMLNERFTITSSNGYYWDMQDPHPPFFRRGIMRAVKKCHR